MDTDNRHPDLTFSPLDNGYLLNDQTDELYISEHQKLSENFIMEFKDEVYWDWICKYQKLSKNFIENNFEKLKEEFELYYNQKIGEKNLIDLIGNTPVIKLNNIFSGDIADIYVKLEGYNLGNSVKDRAALGMIEAAEKAGKLKPGGTIVEPTSGNTGISLALISKLKGYKVILVMPDTMSVERRSIIAAYGAELILTEGKKGMNGAIEKAGELIENNPDFFMPQQFKNSANPLKHYETTGEEIIKDLPDFRGDSRIIQIQRDVLRHQPSQRHRS